jgi:hypothetical protein
MKKIFLDANVIADWMIVSPKIIKTKNDEERNKILENLWKKYTSPKVSFEILELMRHNTINGFNFITSDIALAEVGDVIFKEIRSDDLKNKGIAYRYIPRMIKKLVLSEDEIDNIMSQMSLFRRIFINKNNSSKTKIKIHNRLLEPRLPLYLTSSFRIETYDAYLISQAFDARCNFFVTKEEDLRKEVKIKSLPLISPENLLKIIRKNNH